MSRRIGLNTLFLIPNNVGGTENYTRTFIDALSQSDPSNTYIIFCNRENFRTFTVTSKRFRKVLCPIQAENRLIRILYEQLIFPFILWRNNVDVIHSFGYLGPIWSSAKKIVTVHDTNWKDHREDFSLLSWIMTAVLTQLSLHTADHVITDSSFARERLLHWYPWTRPKLSVILPWIGERLIAELSKRHENPWPKTEYLLCVSGMYPHKKIPYLLDAIQDLPLILVGKNGLDEERVVQRVKSMPNVRYFPKVSLQQLASFYQHASTFVFPSVYEGFGYPVYEALAVGLPTIVSDTKLYEATVRSKLSSLSFESKADHSMMKQKLAKKVQRQPLIFNHDASIQSLVRLYSTL